MVDSLAEFEYGPGAVKLVAKSLVYSKGEVESGIFRHAILSVGMHHERLVPEQYPDVQMWEGDLILVPIRKFTDCPSIKGMRADQMLRSGFNPPDIWLKKIFDKQRQQ